MRNLFSALFKSHPKNIPDTVAQCLKTNFPEAINLEWETKENIFEAVFYLNEVEHIAHITPEGKLIEYKKNLWVNELPALINTEATKLGEIMNAIVIIGEEQQFFEVIIRDSNYNRKLLLFDKNGILLKTSKI